MSGLSTLITDSTEEDALSPAEPQIAGSKKPEESSSIEERQELTDEEEEDKNSREEEEEEEEVTSSAHLEPTTLPWPGDTAKRPHTDNDDGVWSEERDTGFSGGSQDLSEEHSQAKSDRKSKWRESMPEGERWRDDEIEVQRDDKGEGSLADDEDEEDEEEEEGESNWISEKAALGFSPQVTIVRPSSKELPEESRLFIEKDIETEPDSAAQIYSEWTTQDDKYYLCEPLCSEKLKLALSTTAAGLLFPLLVWGGYALLPFESPLLESTPLRVVYTLRCSFFAIIPIMLGVLVQGVARLRYSVLKPLYQSKLLAVLATYISQDLVKLVPLLTIIFVFGRLIYWLCLSLGSSFRGLGFGFSFFPMLAMLGVNLYFICSSVGQGAVFDVEPPTTAPPPRQRWWG
ncbi:transmembrane protein 79 isoform X2 [Cottoperca gobio]|uniref:Transmembrane protein 79 isoform X2 n=1 Tax=Cottoperca gobio TaxID=56716 RepID=A0A6J2QP59_COTGO|nr:transmembrane protein 79-like isoform X2 [Cottoperca gobio]